MIKFIKKLLKYFKKKEVHQTWNDEIDGKFYKTGEIIPTTEGNYVVPFSGYYIVHDNRIWCSGRDD